MYLPDFANRPKNASMKEKAYRMQRVRECLRQRYGGRPGLMDVFKTFAVHKKNHIMADDLQVVLDQMGMKIGKDEAS